MQSSVGGWRTFARLKAPVERLLDSSPEQLLGAYRDTFPELATSRRWLKSGMHQRLDEACGIMRQPVTSSKEKENNILDFRKKDAVLRKKVDGTQRASVEPTREWAVLFAVIKEKLSCPRRRFIAWPRAKNDQEGHGANASLEHISQCLGVTYNETTTLFDLKTSSLQMALPTDMPVLFRCRSETGGAPGVY